MRLQRVQCDVFHQPLSGNVPLTLPNQKSYPDSTHVKPIQPFLYTLTDPSSLLFPLPFQYTLRDCRDGRIVALLNVLQEGCEAIVVVVYLGWVEEVRWWWRKISERVSREFIAQK